MQLTLLLDFSAADARWLGGLVWKAAFVLWLPQLLALWLVLRARNQRLRSRTAEVVRLLVPFMLFVAAIFSAAPVALLLLLYSDVRWDLWLLVLWLPTLVGIGIALATNTSRKEQFADEAEATRSRRTWLRHWSWLSALVIIIGVLTTWQRYRSATPGPSTHDLLWVDEAGHVARTRQDSIRIIENWNKADKAERDERARQDSLRYVEKWGEKQAQTQSW
jgi:hypothetical protein